MSSTIRVSVHGKSCVGCEREKKPIMISLDGKYSKDDSQHRCLDAFLTTEEALELIEDIHKTIKENECK